jgi:predicted ArsR family transcriptional regulator
MKDMDTYSEHIARVSTALADPTRREIMDHVLSADSPLSVRDVAEHFGLHANAARMHLDKLVKGGLLMVIRRRGKRGGRPANLYGASEEDRELNLPPRSYRLLAEVLAGGMTGMESNLTSRLGDEAFRRGREQALRSSSPLAFLRHDADLEAIATAWSQEVERRGFKTRVKAAGRNRVEATFLTCPFGDFSNTYPGLVCDIHRRLEEGFLSLVGDWELETGETGCTFTARRRKNRRRS